MMDLRGAKTTACTEDSFEEDRRGVCGDCARLRWVDQDVSPCCSGQERHAGNWVDDADMKNVGWGVPVEWLRT